MKKIKNELVRLQSLIEYDRFNTGDNFTELIEGDLSNLLKDFFDFRDCPKLLISRCGDKIKVEVVLLADRIKNFSSLPKD